MPDSPGCKHGFHQRADSITQRTHLRSNRISPIDRQFQNPVAEHLGQHDRLNIEAESVLLDARKNFMCGLPAERFEPARGIRDPGRAGQSEHNIEKPAGPFPQPRLMDFYYAFRMPAAPNQHVGLPGCAQKIAHKAERNAQVRIHEKNHLPACAKHAGSDREPFAASGGIGHNDKTGISGYRKAGRGFGVVLSWFDNQQELPGLRRKYASNFPNRVGQARRLVTRGDHNTDARGLIRHEEKYYPKRVFARVSKLPFPEIAILLLAIFLRVWLIEIKPPHFDEGINGWFADQMTANGFYRYDPTNYHGPLHFYAIFLSQTLFGRHVWALRLPAILAGVLCVWATLRFREFFGNSVARLAGLAMAVSPGFVFYSRYSIHESWLALFSILFLWGLLGMWDSGSRRHFFTTVLAAAGMVLTKETYILHIGSFVLAALVLAGWQRMLPSRPAWPLAKQLWSRDDAITGFGLAGLLIVFFYSGTFRDFTALRGLYETFSAWFKTGVDAGGHDKPTYALGPINYYWVWLMARYELPALAGLIACCRFILPSDARYRFIAIAAGGTLLAYSIIPYKTPWCIISIIWPFYILLGGALRECSERLRKQWPWLIAPPLIAFSFGLCLRLNFYKFTDDSEPYVYVQTYSGIFTLTDPLLKLAQVDPVNYQMGGLILLESYYPLPWMLGDFTRVGYYNKDRPPIEWNADFLAIESNRESEIEKNLTKPYFKRRFLLRSAQDECTAYFEAEKFTELLGGTPEFIPGASK